MSEFRNAGLVWVTEPGSAMGVVLVRTIKTWHGREEYNTEKGSRHWRKLKEAVTRIQKIWKNPTSDVIHITVQQAKLSHRCRRFLRNAQCSQKMFKELYWVDKPWSAADATVSLYLVLVLLISWNQTLWSNPRMERGLDCETRNWIVKDVSDPDHLQYNVKDPVQIRHD